MHLAITYPATPSGKRSIRKNVYGNWNGYVSGKRFWEFGYGTNAARTAEYWLESGDLDFANNGAWAVDR